MFVSWLIGKTTNLMLVACHSSYRVPNRSCVNGFIGTLSRWAQFIVCLFDIDLYLSCLLAKNKYACQFELYFHFCLWRLRFCQSVITELSECLWYTRLIHTLFEPQNKKTCLRGLPPSTIQTALLSYTGGKT